MAVALAVFCVTAALCEVLAERSEDARVGRTAAGAEPALVERARRGERWVDAFAEAVRVARVARGRHPALDPRVLAAVGDAGMIAHLSGDQHIAAPVLDLVVEARRRATPPDAPALARALYRRGLAARYSLDRAGARARYDEAIGILARDSGEHPRLEAALVQARASWMRADDYGAALALYREALARRRATDPGSPFDIADNLVWIAWVVEKGGLAGSAAGALDEAERALVEEELTGHSLMAVVHRLRAHRHVLAGELDAAETRLRRAAAIEEASRARQLPGFSRRRTPLTAVEDLAYVLLRRGDHAGAWREHQRASSAIGADFLAARLASRGKPARGRSVRATRDAYLAIRRRDTSGMALAERVDHMLALLEARSEIYRVETELLDEPPLAVPAVPSLQHELADGDAFVGYLKFSAGVQPRRARGPFLSERWAYIVRSSGDVRWVPLARLDRPEQRAPSRTQRETVSELLRRAAAWPYRVADDPELRARSREIAKIELDPLLEHLDGVDTLIVQGNGVRPIELLVDAEGRYFADRFDITYVPSAAALLELSRPVGEDPTTALVLGDGESPERTSLPYGWLETGHVAALFDQSTRLAGDRASAERLLAWSRDRRLKTFDVVHFATHALPARQPERFSLATEGPGELDVEDVTYGFDLDASLVTLSGCGTIAGTSATRGESLGFTQAMLAAGANRILGSVWIVDDRATSILMERFYAAMLEEDAQGPRPRAVARALRRARIALRDHTDADGRRPFAHPVYWGGFVLTGPPRGTF